MVGKIRALKDFHALIGETLAPAGLSLACFDPGPVRVGDAVVLLSIAAFVLRLVCTKGLVAKSDVSASYRHVSTKILSEFPLVLDKVSYELGAHRSRFKLSMESPVADPESTLASFNRQFGLNPPEKEAVDWAWPHEMGNTIFNVVNTYTRAAQMDGLNAESSFRLSRVGGNILGMLK